jgi:outer membrane protein
MIKLARTLTGLLALALAMCACGTNDYGRILSERTIDEYRASGNALDSPDELRPQPDDTVDDTLSGGSAVLELSLEQATMMALRNNRDLEIEQLRPVLSGAYAMIERADYDSELFADIRAEEQESFETSRSTEDQFNFSAENSSLSLGMRQRLATGTDLELAFDQDSSDSDRTPKQDESALRLTVTQSLLRGFGPTVNLASVRQAELGIAASVYELRAFVETLLADTETAYWRLVLAERKLRIFERSLEIAERQRDDIEQRIAVGALAENEAAAARAEVALRRQALIDARHDLELRRLLLLRRIDPDPDGALAAEIEPTAELRAADEARGDLAERMRLAREQRPELNQARLLFEQGRLEVVVTRNGLRPRLDFFVELRKTGYADNFDQSLRNISADDTYDLTLGLRLSHLLGNRAAEGRDLVARAELRQAEAALRNLQQDVVFDVRLAASEVERARQQIDASAATRRLEEQTLVAETERLAVGASTALMVAQAQRDLLSGEIAEVEALINCRIALVNLYLAEGSLLARRGISMPSLDQFGSL